jgi:predicted branched-subunit amino acid permease
MLPVLLGTIPFGFVAGVAAVAAGRTAREGGGRAML